MKAAISTILALTFLCLSPAISTAQETAQKPTRIPSFTKEGSESCLRCHSGEKMRAILASPHSATEIEGTPATTYGCESCHGPGSIHISRAHGGKGFPPLTRFDRRSTHSPRDEQLHACLSCHADESMGEKQIVFMGSAHDRRNINCSTCHIMHTESDPISSKENQDRTCGRCHRKDIRNHPRFEEKSIDFDALSCSTCHDVHVPMEEEEKREVEE
jgi:DmsE family decaheme c-type cytochrome